MCARAHERPCCWPLAHSMKRQQAQQSREINEHKSPAHMLLGACGCVDLSPSARLRAWRTCSGKRLIAKQNGLMHTTERGAIVRNCGVQKHAAQPPLRYFNSYCECASWLARVGSSRSSSQQTHVWFSATRTRANSTGSGRRTRKRRALPLLHLRSGVETIQFACISECA